MRGKEKTKAVAAIITFMAMVLFMPLAAMGGDLEPPAGPGSPGSAMYTIEDIYNYLDIGVAGTKRTGGITEPVAEPGSTGHTLDEIHEKVGQRCITCEGTLSAGGRWCDQFDGTVKDMTTGLVWLKKADWGGTYSLLADFGLPDAHHRAAELWDGSPYEGSAGLSDGSNEGDWRLPTMNEFVGITVGTEYIRSFQMYFFTGVQSSFYWSGTSRAGSPDYAWGVSMYNGGVGNSNKTYDGYVWPVRSDN